ncbi:uncharacterized protein EV420DRAFT_1655983 [Desarmillaria tabescens]|uniref:Uncharacterized protein n=1 Tax=Armillaria tabescens TaxID=1929756 RepID=A0AA39J0A0_ARMTA|nr:uncharacterized protein EV420DRAFT_1655983 [Desarmillaria tabescens]KAK0432103.1 hypothetical protein EV420DRAFT_1655983 [Desarmillaria tabescens]
MPTDDPYAFFNAPACPRRLVPLTKERHWRVMQAAIKSQRLGKLYGTMHMVIFSITGTKADNIIPSLTKPVDVPKKNSYFVQDEDSEDRFVMASPGNTSGDSEIDIQYNGPSTWDFMMLDLEVSNGSTRILQALKGFRVSFDVGVISRNLRAGLKETWEALHKLERLADWIDNADLRQWQKAEEEHQWLWKGWERFVEKENHKPESEKVQEGYASG